MAPTILYTAAASHSQIPIQRPKDRRPASLAELAERVRNTNGSQWDPNLGIKHWLKTAERHRTNGNDLVKSGDLEPGFVELAIAAGLVLEKVPSHRDYSTMLNQHLRKNLGNNGQEILDSLSQLKPVLLERYERWAAKHSEEPHSVADSTTDQETDSGSSRTTNNDAIRPQEQQSAHREEEDRNMWGRYVREEESMQGQERGSGRRPSEAMQTTKRGEQSLAAERAAVWLSTPRYGDVRNGANSTPLPDSQRQQDARRLQTREDVKLREEDITGRRTEPKERRRQDQKSITRTQPEGNAAANAALSGYHYSNQLPPHAPVSRHKLPPTMVAGNLATHIKSLWYDSSSTDSEFYADGPSLRVRRADHQRSLGADSIPRTLDGNTSSPPPISTTSTSLPDGGVTTTATVSRSNVKVYQHLLALVAQQLDKLESPDPHLRRLEQLLQIRAEDLGKHDPILILIECHQYRSEIFELLTELGIRDDAIVAATLEMDENNLFSLMRDVLRSHDGKQSVLSLASDDAERFMVLLQSLLDKSSTWIQGDEQLLHIAQRLIIKLARVSGILPSSLSIEGVNNVTPRAIRGGAFADIYRAQYGGKEVALKKFRVFECHDRHNTHRMLCKEALLWKQLHHDNVLPFLGLDADTFPGFVCMVSPWMQHGTILEYIRDTNPSAKGMTRLLFQVTRGVEYLHSNKVVHGDLRGANIFIDDHWGVRIADFGLAIFSEATLTAHTLNGKGTMRWMGPELHFPEKFGLDICTQTYATDVYALACTFVEVFTLTPPFSHIRNDTGVLMELFRGGRPRRPETAPEQLLPDDLWNLVQACWSEHPSERPAIGIVVGTIRDWSSGSSLDLE